MKQPTFKACGRLKFKKDYPVTKVEQDVMFKKGEIYLVRPEALASLVQDGFADLVDEKNNTVPIKTKPTVIK